MTQRLNSHFIRVQSTMRPQGCSQTKSHRQPAASQELKPKINISFDGRTEIPAVMCCFVGFHPVRLSQQNKMTLKYFHFVFISYQQFYNTCIQYDRSLGMINEQQLIGCQFRKPASDWFTDLNLMILSMATVFSIDN